MSVIVIGFILGERQDITFMRIWHYIYEDMFISSEREDIIANLFKSCCMYFTAMYAMVSFTKRTLISPELLVISLENPDIYLNTYLMHYHINIQILQLIFILWSIIFKLDRPVYSTTNFYINTYLTWMLSFPGISLNTSCK